jgi:hypothetical protein
MFILPIYICRMLRNTSFFFVFSKILASGRSVGLVTGYVLNDRSSEVRFPAGARNFFLLHRVQTGSGAHPASYSVGTRDSFPGGKNGRGVKLTTHLLVPRSRMNGAIPPPQYVFMAWCLFKYGDNISLFRKYFRET